jgi:anti-sigma-K factor RskA
MNHDEWLERAEIYALGALDREDLTLFEAHLVAGCALCETHLRESREALIQLPRSLAPLEPPPRVKTVLLKRIAPETKRAIAERTASPWLWWSLAGGLAAAALLIAVSWNLIASRNQVRELQGRLAALQSQVNEREEVIRFLSDPQVRIVNLAALPASPGASGQLLWNPRSSAGLLLVTGLPPTTADKAYELWGIAGAEPVPAGVFTVNQGGVTLFRLPALPQAKNFDKFAVTLEPAGGVPQPTGPMHLLGNV